jgi:hypothetical protein
MPFLKGKNLQASDNDEKFTPWKVERKCKKIPFTGFETLS